VNQAIRNTINQDWITLIIIGCLVLITFVKYRYPKKFEDFLLIISSDKFLSTSIQNNSLTHPFNSILALVQWISISLFIYIGYCFYSQKVLGQEYIIYLYILIGYVIFEQLKLVLERFIGYLIQLSQLIKPYTYRKVVFKNFLSLLTLVFCVVLTYKNANLKEYYGVFLGVFLFIYLISLLFTVRKFQNEILGRPSYFILYFCTLEIAPYYILYKVLV